MKNDTYYGGEFNEDEMHGLGKLVISKTEIYDGQFLHGKMTG